MSDPNRRDQIVRLLETRDDGLPLPRHRSEASAGFVHQTLAPVVCETCEGVDSFGCTGCGGRGWVERMRHRDPMASEKVAPYGLDGSRHEATRERDRQIEVLGQQLRPATSVDELADANANPYGWERVRRAMYAAFDYAALDRALERLHSAFPGLAPMSDRGLRFLDEHLPDPLRAPKPPVEAKPRVAPGPLRPEAGAATKQLRDAAIRARAGEGVSPGELAAEFRVSIRTVYQAVKDAA